MAIQDTLQKAKGYLEQAKASKDTTPTASDVGIPEITDPLGGRDLDREADTINSIGLDAAALGILDPLQLFEATYTPEELAGIPDYQNLKASSEKFQTAQETMLGTPQPTTSMMRVLENALKKKSGVAEQPLGESELFKAAGLSGYAVLSQSLAERSREMENKYTNFTDLMQTTGEQLVDAWNITAKNYEILKSEYDSQMDRMNGIIDGIVEQERAMEILEREHEMDLELATLKASLESAKPGKASDYDPDAIINAGGEFANRVTGTGTITSNLTTGIGSSAWKWGLDIAGAPGSAILSPGEATVLEVISGHASVGPNNEAGYNQNGGFGNQVKLRLADGNEIWVSHLESVNPDLFVGATVSAGSSVGTMGNTGYTMGNTGVHADITMKDAEGNYLDINQVADYIGGDVGTERVGGKQIEQALPDWMASFIPDDISMVTINKDTAQIIYDALNDPFTMRTLANAIKDYEGDGPKLSESDRKLFIKNVFEGDVGLPLQDALIEQLYLGIKPYLK